MDGRMMSVYVIRDKVAECVGPVFVAENNGVAARSYRQSMAKVVDPADYQLLRIGDLDLSTGQLYADETPSVVDVVVPTQAEISESMRRLISGEVLNESK